MPNHVYNKITGKKKDFEKLIKKGEISFCRIIGMPTEIFFGTDFNFKFKIENEKQRMKLISELKLLPAEELRKLKLNKKEIKGIKKSKLKKLLENDSWYNWSLNNWGTKWDAYNQNITELDDETIQIEFQTAWGNVLDLMTFLSEKEQIEFSYEWIEEQGAEQLGRTSISKGEIIEGDIPEPWSKEAYEMMFEMWGNESEYEWSEEEESYKYKEEEYDEEEDEEV